MKEALALLYLCFEGIYLLLGHEGINTLEI
jgi:hypothetical protein